MPGTQIKGLEIQTLRFRYVLCPWSTGCTRLPDIVIYIRFPDLAAVRDQLPFRVAIRAFWLSPLNNHIRIVWGENFRE